MLVHRAADFVQNVLKFGRLREGPLPVVAGDVHGHLVSGHVTYGAIVVHRNLLVYANL
ncbi:hypothetical protein NJB14197_53470 [Mycobacterium montefiorense]|uniref:Uncharacterized protein n=1 Tax=Mycobacterium montefiorense TaxID=154654 RepID=A0AA37PPG4_9MYCO|nr:hypothetical protein MmonteBS_47550 [Mycobacterium montefiorense]GKU36518.1 hypothetical protein NJB14191_38640 [Mycobacterium montefiorense]GKU39447.1 hypothetical protein NJB14192_14410 [Mycobacterium montefiorense]GKU44563.1 hypothetical protein NJB14194_11890 [Mycobacterium montefiorense]GKU53949.1 hypothetical protein NJB14195_51900 [Mycobacterium montefiorense]